MKVLFSVFVVISYFSLLILAGEKQTGIPWQFIQFNESDSIPGVRFDPAGGLNPVRNVFLIIGGEFYEPYHGVYTDVWEFDFATLKWKNTIINDTDVIPASSRREGAHNTDGQFYLWGGLANTEAIYVLNSLSTSWQTLPVQFPLRTLSGFTLNIYNNKIYVYGGTVDFDAGETSLWMYDIAATSSPWTKLADASNGAPVGRYFHSADVHLADASLYIFGGSSNIITGKNLNDFWRFNFNDNSWTSITTDQECIPAARGLHASVIEETKNILIIHGGISGGVDLDDLWIYTFAGNQWKRILTESWIPENSSQRDGHLMIYYENYIYLFAGDKTMHNSVVQHNDMHRLLLPDCDYASATSCTFFYEKGCEEDGNASSDVSGLAIGLVFLGIVLLCMCIFCVSAIFFIIVRRRQRYAGARAEERMRDAVL